MSIHIASILRLSRELQRATTTEQLIEAAREAVSLTTGYRTAWLALVDRDPDPMVEILLASGSGQENIARLPRFPSRGDAMLAEIFACRAPVVVEDARTDPRTNKEIVAQVGNRTIVNVPLLLGDDLLGALGAGTFAPEEPRAPGPGDLEHLVVIATQVAAALQRVQLLQSQASMQRQLQAAQRLESLAVLAGGVAHDFNNLLTVVLSSLELARPDVGAEPRGLIDDAMEAASRGAQLTRQLLALARRQPMELAPVDVAARLRALLGMARRLLPESIAIEAAVPERLPQVLADGPQLDQVLLNLFVNARDAMPGGGRLRVTASEVAGGDERGRMLRVTVADDGVGMSQEVLEHVLEPFFTTKEPGQGTGLGLSVAAGIVEQHGGKLEVRSAPGQGATFDVSLPVFDGTGTPPHEATAHPAATSGRERVLLAEDERAVRAIAERVLALAGYRVTAVADGREAIEAARSGRTFDLIVLDAVMPRVGGRQAWEEIRLLQPAARFLVVSGHAAMAFRPEEIRELGIPFLEKPYTPETLLAAVAGALRLAPAPRGTVA
ncbi:MAG: response regulator [Deltaproteobacteria bacterium]|nr:response regulator [Deltaproteobacteria bacterium]